MCNLEKDKLFSQLHKDYYVATDLKDKINLRNAILTALIPLLEKAVNRFSSLNPSAKEDLFQDLVEYTVTKFIPKWKPTGKSITAYYKRCFWTTGLNWIEARKVWSDKEVSIDSESYFWEATGEEDEEKSSFYSNFKFEDSNTQLVYALVLELMQEGSLPETVTPFVTFFKRYLKTAENNPESEYYKTANVVKDFSIRELRSIYTHALITCRDHYLDSASEEEQDIELDSLFGRMTEYLSKQQTQNIIKVFGGCAIKIPKWED